MQRTQIKDIKPNTKVKIAGFVDTIRDKKSMQFIIIRDVTGKVQIFVSKDENPKIAETFTSLLPESVVELEGEVKENAGVKMGGVEIIPTSVKVLSNCMEALPINELSLKEQLLDYRWLDLRQERKTLTLRVQSKVCQFYREFLTKQGFTEIHSPKLIGTASESGSTVFEVKYTEKTKAYLAQSPQFYKQMAIASGLEKVFEVAPVFRAEKSHTSRHMTEYTGLDLEMAYIDSYEDVMKLQEKLLAYIIENIKKELGEEIKRVFNIDVVVPKLPFPRIKLSEITKDDDLTTEEEKNLGKLSVEKYNNEFIFVTDFPTTNRAFYHERSNGGKTANGYDLVFKGLEITTGAKREHRYETLKKQANEKGLGKDVEFYLNFFKYGCPPHGGFGMGLERVVQQLLNLENVKDAAFIPRDPDRLHP